MAIGPRLEFRQSQTLVMTPQLRQAIKLLQFSNLEVAAYVEEELERNPLLERDERAEVLPEYSAPDQRTETLAGLDASDLIRREKLPDLGWRRLRARRRRPPRLRRFRTWIG
jgi:RNA polymerase sigma-54 factor